MATLEEICAHLTGTSRAIVISEKEVDLSPRGADNTMFLLKIGEGSLAAGGRGGGFGERKVTAVFCYAREGEGWSKLYEAEGEEAEGFEVPYYVARLPMTMADGEESVGYGVVDKELVADLLKKSGLSSP
ncbi:MAG: hypothetical protein JRN44_00685 [Nitrososphaerota archaeon]|jgi:hypothetical protein|nr:hypothetical protein [Nitrososphaerota archaeon]MDG6941805.1 hypothetical protein [Nitrososphaerota archaeon]MDG6947022.1 hypothetical protein [Nitrososphaerota archaeon]MDG6950566.1 hypothetical protein [Nitrososphaerota archaeon]